MADITISRRAALLGLAGGAAAALTAGRAPLAMAGGPKQGVLRPMIQRVGLGAFEVSTLFDGRVQIDGPHPIFGEDQSAEDVAALMTQNFLPETRFEISFTPVLVNTGSELVLFDTGNGANQQPDRGNLLARLSEAGVAPDQIDVVVITHFHPDHIGGLTVDGKPAFPNARYVAGATEHNWWRANAAVRGPENEALLNATAFAVEDKMTFLEDGQDVVAGITAMSAFGHTPGHTIYHLQSEGRRLMITGDTANHYVASLERPDWHVRFDMNKEDAAASRKKVFGMLAAERIPFAGYHMPFPAVGYVVARGQGFHYVPASYQVFL